MALMSSRRFMLVSLFCGCGGGDLGFCGDFEFLGQYYGRLPFGLVWANDLDPFAWKVHAHNFGTPGTPADIRKIDFNSPEFAGTSIDVLLAGFPCQEFALLGPRGGLKSHRGQLYKEIRRALVALQPKVFLAENVPGIEHPPSTLSTIVRYLAGRAAPLYRIKPYRINAADYGVPQTRHRILILGIRSDIREEFQPPLPVRRSPSVDLKELPPWLTAQEALEDLWCSVGPERSTVPDQEKVTRATIVLAPARRRDSILRPDSVAPTIRAEHHGHVELHYHTQADGSLRHLTVRECARLQGFPDTFTFPVSFTQAYRQIGNAMPPVMMYHWASSVAKWLRKANAQASKKQTTHRDPLVTSRIMAAVKSKGSKAERALGRAMWKLGLRYKKHPKHVPGQPDYAFTGPRVAVFCDGDFWHGLGWKQRGFSTWDEQFKSLRNGEFWREKIRRNMERDKEVNEELRSSGWTVLRLRESEILKDPDRCAAVARDAIATPGAPSIRGRPAVGARRAPEDRLAAQIR